MKREKKEILIESIRGVFKNFSTILIIHLSKMSAVELNLLRGDLWDKGADLKVVKNSLFGIVLLENSFQGVVDNLSEEIAILYSHDVLSLSKLLIAFVRNSDNRANVINMIHEGKLFSREGVEKVATLPNLMILRSKLIYFLKYGLVGKLTRLLDIPKRQLVDVLKICANNN